MTTKQTITKEIVKEAVQWLLKHKGKPITPRSLKPILERHITPEIGIEEMTDYLSSREGRRVWHSAMRAELKLQS